MTDLSGWNAKSNLKWMEPIFEKWIECNKRYQDLHVDGSDDDDSLFFTRERPAVGILAGAAWAVENGYAVQEYFATKRKKSDLRKKGYGREDLYIGIGDEAIRIEAKHKWVNAYERLNGYNDWTLVEEIDETLNDAIEDAGRNEKFIHHDNRAGMAIAQFYALEHKEEDKPICDIEDVAQVVSKIKKGASAWYFDKDKWVLDEPHYYFGTALFISSV